MHYVDTSALVAYFVPEAYSAKTETVLRDARRYPLTISEWTATEFVSALGIKCRTGQLDETQSLAVQERFKTLSGNFTWLPVIQADFQQAANWLRNWRLGLRSGDALHLVVAYRQEYAVSSLDERLVEADKTLGIPTKLIR